MTDPAGSTDPFGLSLARSPLAGLEDDLAAAGAEEIKHLTQVSLRLAPSLAARLRLTLPSVPNTWVTTGGWEVLWLGPDEWLVVAQPGAATTVTEVLAATVTDSPDPDPDAAAHASVSVVDVSAARAVLELTGGDRHELLASGCGLDLHPRAWRPGQCAQTLLARVPVLLQERTTATRVFVRASYAAHLAAWLRAAA